MTAHHLSHHHKSSRSHTHTIKSKNLHKLIFNSLNYSPLSLAYPYPLYLPLPPSPPPQPLVIPITQSITQQKTTIQRPQKMPQHNHPSLPRPTRANVKPIRQCTHASTHERNLQKWQKQPHSTAQQAKEQQRDDR